MMLFVRTIMNNITKQYVNVVEISLGPYRNINFACHLVSLFQSKHKLLNQISHLSMEEVSKEHN